MVSIEHKGNGGGSGQCEDVAVTPAGFANILSTFFLVSLVSVSTWEREVAVASVRSDGVRTSF